MIALLLATTVADAKSVDERKWILVESENFAIHSSLSEKKTVSLMKYLEALRGVFAQPGPATDDLSQKPTVIFVLGQRSDYRALGFPENTAGIFMPELRQNFIVIRNNGNTQESQVILHEYVHFIMQATSRFPYPKWWSEGFAEYVSSSRLSKKEFSIGLPLKIRLNWLHNSDWLRWEDVINPVNYADYNRKHVSQFYAQSWLLVHFLHNRKDRSRGIGESWDIVLQETQSGSEPVAAFEKGFGLTIEELQSEITSYYRKGRYRYWKVPAQEALTDLDVSVSRISQNQIQISLGQIALRLHDSERARLWFQKALQQSPGNALAIAGIARSYEIEGQLDEAEVHFKKALELGSDNPTVLIDYAKFALEKASSNDAWFTGADFVDKAESLLLRAKELSESSVEIDTYLAVSYMSKDKDSMEAVQLLWDVVRRSPSDQWPVLLLAQLFQAQGHDKNAIALAELLLRTEHQVNAHTLAARQVILDIENDQETTNQPRPRIAEPQLPE